MDGSTREDRRRSLLWIGGPPGQTLIRLKEKLERDGLSVDDVQTAFQRISRRTDLVLVNVDMVSHNSFDAVRAAAKLRGVLCVPVHNDYSRTRAALEQAGILRPTFPNTAETPGGFMSDKVDSSSVEACTTSEMTAPALYALVSDLPKPLLPYLQQLVARRLREDDVQLAATAIVTLDTDGLLDLIGALPEEKRVSLKAALQ